MLTPGNPMPTLTWAAAEVIEQSSIQSTKSPLRIFYPSVQ
jgi:hypothetical protein